MKRSYREDRESIVRTLVPRLWCELNYNIRHKTGKKKQYILTILPGFLIPHSTIPLEAIMNSAEQYIIKLEISEQEAALLMHCENVSSFSLHFSRIKERLDRWILFPLECIIALGGEIKQDGVTSGEEYTQPLKCKWRRLTQLIEQYMTLYSSLKGAQLVLSGFYAQYIHVRLSHRKMGLEP